MRKFNSEELKQSDGKGGRPAYIALNGKVYDVTGSYLWTNGEHQGEYFAGHDLTSTLANAPHSEEKLDNFKQVGIFG